MRSPDDRRHPGQQREEDSAGGVDVGAGVDAGTAGLFRGHVGHRADRNPGGSRRAGVVDRAGDAEVHHLDRAGAGDHHVAGLDVSVHSPVAVAEVQRGADVGDDLHRPVRHDPALVLEDVAQRPAFDVLHHDVRGAPVDRVVLAGVVHRHDRRVVQRPQGPRLPAEPGLEKRVSGKIGTQHLDRDLAAESHVPAEVNLAHRAVTDLLAHLVPRSQQPWRGHRRPGYPTGARARWRIGGLDSGDSPELPSSAG
jgi:hypothetical protein